MDQRVFIVDQFTATMASIQEALASLRQKIDMPQTPPYLLHGHSKIASPAVRIRQLRVSDSSTAWDDLEGH
ncbi:hypothetical protein AAG906_004738 [Vitis piasezkii]